jgi:lipopolysaccharide/colanic/teichoic acid biosynthesis glycosyltransferase
MYKSYIKPIFDFTVALFCLILFSPILLITIIVLTLANRSNPFFFQKRPGQNGKIFCLIKFKTMNDKKDETGNLLPDVDRLTTVGRFVRKASLDEIPQLLNVLKGEMSLVGPRPLLVEYLPLYNRQQARRHEVKPGITGLAQVKGRNALSWNQKFDYDIWYVDNLSFATDLRIIWLTIQKVVKSEGINSSSTMTMERFIGNNSTPY